MAAAQVFNNFRHSYSNVYIQNQPRFYFLHSCWCHSSLFLLLDLNFCNSHLLPLVILHLLKSFLPLSASASVDHLPLSVLAKLMLFLLFVASLSRSSVRLCRAFLAMTHRLAAPTKPQFIVCVDSVTKALARKSSRRLQTLAYGNHRCVTDPVERQSTRLRLLTRIISSKVPQPLGNDFALLATLSNIAIPLRV